MSVTMSCTLTVVTDVEVKLKYLTDAYSFILCAPGTSFSCAAV